MIVKKKTIPKELQKAHKLFRRRQYVQVITLLENERYLFRDSFIFYYYISLSCLYTGDFASAHTYFTHALRLRPRDIISRLGLAITCMRRGRSDESLALWLDILNDDKHNKQAKAGLFLFRTNDIDNTNFFDLFEQGKLIKLYPPQPKYIPVWPIFVLLAGLLLWVFIRNFAPLWDKIQYMRIEKEYANENMRDGSQQLYTLYNTSYTLDIQELKEQNINSYFTFSNESLQRQISSIFTYFNEYRDNKVIIEVNRVLLSNADERSRLILRNLLQFTRVPQFNTFRDAFTYYDVLRFPLLYSNVYIKWRGRVANMREEVDALRFDFLVGYDTLQAVDAVLPVVFTFPITVDNNVPIELIAQLNVDNTSATISGLTGVAIRYLNPESPEFPEAQKLENNELFDAANKFTNSGFNNDLLMLDEQKKDSRPTIIERIQEVL